MVLDKKIRVADSLCGQRLDMGLLRAGLVVSRSQGQSLIEQKKVLINSKPEKASYKLKSGDLIEISFPSPKQTTLIPYDFPLDIVFEDDFVIVVNKPAGLVVHPSCGHESDTLVNALLSRKIKLSPGSSAFRPGLVHRIDKGTSGLLVLAKTEAVHFDLARQFSRKSIQRNYLALCFKNKNLEKGRIESFIIRDPSNRKRFTNNHLCDFPSKGKKAISHYEKKWESRLFALYGLKLETGRTHQIRVHLSSNQNPIVGDDLYNGKNQARNLKNHKLKTFILKMDRFALHAYSLGFKHPVTREDMIFKVPIPLDLQPLFEMLKISDKEIITEFSTPS